MKSRLLLSLFLTFSFYLLSSQVPRGFNYQGIARDGSGNPIANQDLMVKVSVLSDTTGFYASGSGTYIWEEQHSVHTNAFGLFGLVIGTEAWVQGSAATFDAIDWNQGPLFVGIKIQYPSPSWKNMGTAPLNSVPYSMVADMANGIANGSKLEVISDDDLGTDALFEVRRKDGQTVFAVYPDAVSVFVPNSAKGAKGGFSIGGFDQAKGTSQDLFRVTPDSTRIYIPNPALTGKGAKGGFSIGGFDQAKGITQDLLSVSPDSTRIYVREPAKGSKGGFSIGGFGTNKGTLGNFLDLTPDNYFIGDGSGSKNIAGVGLYNSFIGYEAGLNNTTGSYNAFFGYQSGYSNTEGSKNLFLGYQSGYYNITGDLNTFVGYQAGNKNTIGTQNSFLGSYSGANTTTGGDNTFIGY